MIDMCRQIHLACDLPPSDIDKMIKQAQCDITGDAMAHPFLVSIAKTINPF